MNRDNCCLFVCCLFCEPGFVVSSWSFLRTGNCCLSVCCLSCEQVIVAYLFVVFLVNLIVAYQWNRLLPYLFVVFLVNRVIVAYLFVVFLVNR